MNTEGDLQRSRGTGVKQSCPIYTSVCVMGGGRAFEIDIQSKNPAVIVTWSESGKSH